MGISISSIVVLIMRFYGVDWEEIKPRFSGDEIKDFY